MEQASSLQGFLSISDMQEIMDAGASHTGIYVNIKTDYEGSTTYEILAQGVDGSQNFLGKVYAVCPTPCPTT